MFLLYTGKKMIQHGKLTPINYLGRKLFLDLTQPHEGKYARAIERGSLFPQMDIDDMVFKIFLRRGASCLDAGSNIGLTATQMLARGAARVVCIEPDPSLVARLVKNLAGDALIIEAALIPSSRDREKFAKLYLSDAHNQGSTLCEDILQMFPSVWNKELRTIEPQLITLADIVSRYGRFDFWKLDIEGLEIPVIKEALLRLPRELHPDCILFESYKGLGEIGLLADEFPEFIFFHCFVQSDTSRLELTPFATRIGAEIRKGESRRAGTSPMYLALRLCVLGEFVASIASRVPFGPLDSCARNLCISASLSSEYESDLSRQLTAQSKELQQARRAFDDLVAQSQKLELDLASITAELNSVSKEKLSAHQNIAELNKQLAAKSQALVQMQVELAKKSSALVDAEGVLSQISVSLRQLVDR